MARVQLVIPDDDRARFVQQARREGMTLSAWLRAAAHDRLQQRERTGVFDSPENLAEFFRRCDDLAGSEPEPDWDEHLAEIERARGGGAAHT
jgi:hypothetical protein